MGHTMGIGNQFSLAVCIGNAPISQPNYNLFEIACIVVQAISSGSYWSKNPFHTVVVHSTNEPIRHM